MSALNLLHVSLSVIRIEFYSFNIPYCLFDYTSLHPLFVLLRKQEDTKFDIENISFTCSLDKI